MPTPQTKPEDGYGYLAYDPNINTNPGGTESKRILFGLGFAAWSLLLVALTAIIVGAAVGGGVGGALSSCTSVKSSLNDKLASCSTPIGNTTGGVGCAPSVSIALVTATVTVSASSASGTAVVAPIDLSNYTIVSPAAIADLHTGCPALNMQAYPSSRGDTHDIYCGTDSGYGSPTLKDPNLTLQVFAGFVSYTLDDCMEVCSAFNAFSTRNNVSEMQCRSITFHHRMSKFITDNDFVNC